MRLVASDIDGTILGHDGKISNRTVRAFHACRDAGVELVFVTGRPPRWLHPLQDQLGHTGTVICSNGAVVWDLEADKLVSARTLGIDAVLEARRVIKRLRPAALFAAETLTGFHLEPGFIENASSELLSEFTPAPLAETLVADDAVVKFLAIVREGTADQFLAEVAPGVSMLELALPGVNKAVALAEYAAALGIGAEDVVAFGDMPNDIEMLRWAGHGYGMASGHPEAIRAAGRQAPHFDDDGVAQVLESRLASLGVQLS
jgi:Cof subfamily protein (haloacid dehalogenase superfamily)